NWMATSSRHALCTLVRRAELKRKKIGPHGTVIRGRVGGGGTSCVVTVNEQLPPGHGSPQRVRSGTRRTVTVMGPMTPVVLSVTSRPVAADSLPPVVVQS